MTITIIAIVVVVFVLVTIRIMNRRDNTAAPTRQVRKRHALSNNAQRTLEQPTDDYNPQAIAASTRRERRDFGATFRTGEGRGVVTVTVIVGSPAARIGLKPGATVLTLNGQAVDDADTARLLLEQQVPGRPLLLTWRISPEDLADRVDQVVL